MKPYHKYVFDEEKRIFLGKFEEMYQQEDVENFDSWHQDTLTALDKKITLAILDQYNFHKILDIGCGKGSFTHLLKKENNSVTGIDISETAIRKARSKYPGIELQVGSGETVRDLKQKFDLILMMETLSYIKEWKLLISDLSVMTQYLYVSLFVPDSPIGYVKSMNDLCRVIEKHFDIIYKLVDETAKRIFCFSRRKR